MTIMLKYVTALLIALLSVQAMQCCHGKIRAHIIPHSHDDVGWLKTEQQYYYGLNNSIQRAGVKYILDEVITSLLQDPTKTFVYSEQAFFQQWWSEQDEALKHKVRELVASGQFEFVGGGWVQHDEAAAHFVDMIDQTTLGQHLLQQEFNATVRVAWQLDPFGHSATAALIASESGANALFLGRSHYQLLEVYMQKKSLEFIWYPSYSRSYAKIFTWLSSSGNYGSPPGFCFDIGCNDPLLVDNPASDEYNIKQRVDLFVEHVRNEAKTQRGNNVLILVGSDFQFQSHQNFINLDKLLHYLKNDGRIEAFYSTPSRYLQSKYTEKLTFPTVREFDFFPYADNSEAYWTGYFTSRPALKRFIRVSSGLLKAVKQLSAFVLNDSSAQYLLMKAQASCAHHDAVTGTSKQHVANDYAKRLSRGIQAAFEPLISDPASLLGARGDSFPLRMCLELNMSLCEVSQMNDKFTLLLYNPLARTRAELIKLPVHNNYSSWHVLDPDGAEIPNQIVNIEQSSILQFIAVIRGLTLYTYTIQSKDMLAESNLRIKQESDYQRIQQLGLHNSFRTHHTHSIQNEAMQLFFDPHDYNIMYYSNRLTGTTYPLSVAVGYYLSMPEKLATTDNKQPGGAYIFRPYSNMPVMLTNCTLMVFRGSLSQELYQQCDGWVSLTFRLRSGTEHIDIDYSVGPVPIEDGFGKEVFVKYDTAIDNNGVFYTDSNGRELLRRQRDTQPAWPLKQTQPVSGNVYPITSNIRIEDGHSALSILVDRACGAMSLDSGDIEIFLHRRLLEDDWRGVGEALNETAGGVGLSIIGNHYLLLGDLIRVAADSRQLAQRLYYPLIHFFTPSVLTSQNFSFIANELPPEVDLLTLESLDRTTLLLRLQHNFGVSEHPQHSEPVSICLHNLFSIFRIVSVQERSLTDGPKLLQSIQQNSQEGTISTRMQPQSPIEQKSFVIKLHPLEIKTFRIVVERL